MATVTFGGANNTVRSMPASSKNVVRALQLATEYHYKQTDLVGEPYILHILAVWKQMPDDRPDLQSVALLHDILEDTQITQLRLQCEGFSWAVVGAVLAITKQKDEEYFDYLDRVKGNELARIVKLADLQHNLRGNTALTAKRKAKYEAAVEYLTA